MTWTLKTATVLNADVASLKAFCRVTHELEDELFLVWFGAALQWLEHYTGRGLLTSTWQLSTASLPTRVMLPFAAPLQSVTYVKYYDADNALQTWVSTSYITPAFHEPAVLEVLPTATWPSYYDRSDAWQVEYIVGHTSVDLIPVPLQLAIRMLVAHWNENREAVMTGAVSKEVEFSVQALAAPYRLRWVSEC